jgi:hypothetical protein
VTLLPGLRGSVRRKLMSSSTPSQPVPTPTKTRGHHHGPARLSGNLKDLRTSQTRQDLSPSFAPDGVTVAELQSGIPRTTEGWMGRTTAVDKDAGVETPHLPLGVVFSCTPNGHRDSWPAAAHGERAPPVADRLIYIVPVMQLHGLDPGARAPPGGRGGCGSPE